MKLKRYTTFKWEKSYVLYCVGEYVFVDGLNENVDIFKLSDFSLIGTLETNEKCMISMITIEDKLFIGC